MTDRVVGQGPDAVSAELAGTLAAITARLVGSPDHATVLRLVNEVGTGPLGAAATGLILLRARGGLEVAAASDETAQFIELLQTHIDQGPCVDCIAEAAAVTAPDLTAERGRWPGFVPAALEAGYRAVVAIPLKLDGVAVGGFNLLYDTPTTLPRWQLELAQLVSDLAVLALSQEPGDRRADRFVEATVTTLNDRIEFDQAVGFVGGKLGIEPAAARALVTGYAIRQGRALRDVVRAITGGAVDPAMLAETGD